jgi:macrolide transport system ATP-binding/permease protein
MRWVHNLRLRLRSLFRRSRVEQELNAELQFHLEQQIEENLAAGMSREEARYVARRTFGTSLP